MCERERAEVTEMGVIPAELVRTEEVKGWRGMHLFHAWTSSCSRKVRILLRLLDFPYTDRVLDLRKNENTTEWYLGINPRGLVPVLVHDGVVHVESNHILEYLSSLAAAKGQPSFTLHGDSGHRVKELLDLEDSLHLAIRTLSVYRLPYRFVKAHAMNNTKKLKATFERDKAMGIEGQGVAEQIEFYRNVLEHGGLPDEDTRRAFSQIQESFVKIEELLSQSKNGGGAGHVFLLGRGTRPTMADIAWFVYALRMQSLGYPLAKRHPLFAEHYALLRKYHPVFEEEACRQEESPALKVFGALRWMRGRTLLNVAEPNTIAHPIVRMLPAIIALALAFFLISAAYA